MSLSSVNHAAQLLSRILQADSPTEPVCVFPPAKPGLPALADAWSTALFVLGLDRALELWRAGEGTVAGMELILVTEDQRIYVTQGLEEGLQLHGEEAGYTYEIVRR